MENFIIVAVLLVIVGLAVGYIVKSKRSGKKCIGCPDSGSCGKNGPATGCGCGCSGCSFACHPDDETN